MKNQHNNEGFYVWTDLLFVLLLEGLRHGFPGFYQLFIGGPRRSNQVKESIKMTQTLCCSKLFWKIKCTSFYLIHFQNLKFMVHCIWSWIVKKDMAWQQFLFVGLFCPVDWNPVAVLDEGSVKLVDCDRWC